MFLKVAQEQAGARQWWRGLCGQREGGGRARREREGADREGRAQRKWARDTGSGERQTEVGKEMEVGGSRERGTQGAGAS